MVIKGIIKYQYMYVQPHFWFFGLRYGDLVGQSCPFYKEKIICRPVCRIIPSVFPSEIALMNNIIEVYQSMNSTESDSLIHCHFVNC